MRRHPLSFLRRSSAVIAAKSVGGASRYLGKGGGTTLPGDVARAIDKGVLAAYCRRLPRGAIMVTGTNGKTTTSSLLVHILRRAGLNVVANGAGANLIFGVTAAAITDGHLSGRPRADIAVFEVDELATPVAVTECAPRAMVVTNLLRDQLDRSGELTTTATAIGRALAALPSTSLAIFNGDDPTVAALVPETCSSLSFGIEDSSVTTKQLSHVADTRRCPKCSAPLTFTAVVLAHCGWFSCEGCGFARAKPDVAAASLTASMESLSLRLGDGLDLTVPLGGVYNGYNVLAAISAAKEVGIADEVIVDACATFTAPFGRLERLVLGGRRMRLILAKNPTGMTEVIRMVRMAGISDIIVAINDGIADGRDVSWLWDVDFESLEPDSSRVIASGRRALDLGVRLKYAGLGQDRVTVVPSLEDAIGAFAKEGGDDFCLIATYTSMLEAQRIATREGATGDYWDTQHGAGERRSRKRSRRALAGKILGPISSSKATRARRHRQSQRPPAEEESS